MENTREPPNTSRCQETPVNFSRSQRGFPLVSILGPATCKSETLPMPPPRLNSFPANRPFYIPDSNQHTRPTPLPYVIYIFLISLSRQNRSLYLQKTYRCKAGRTKSFKCHNTPSQNCCLGIVISNSMCLLLMHPLLYFLILLFFLYFLYSDILVLLNITYVQCLCGIEDPI